MKISFTFSGTYYCITPSILEILSVKALNIEKAIELFNIGIDKFCSEIKEYEGIELIKLSTCKIPYDISKSEISFSFDKDAWGGYKKYLCQIEGRKMLTQKRKEELLCKGNIEIIKNELPAMQDWTISEKLSGDILIPDLDNANPNSPFYNKRMVFTGVLDTMSREQAASYAKDMGADINTTISSSTDFVVVGKNAGPFKMKKIEQYNAMGGHIVVLNEAEFLNMITNQNN